MSASASAADKASPVAKEVQGAEEGLPPLTRGLILAALTLCTTLVITSTLVMSVILPQMQGSLSATQDQVSWTVTLNIIAIAVATPISGWLGANFGQRKVMLVCVCLFAVSTLLCGLADSLGSLIVFRIIQGLAGAPMLPTAQAIILAVYPKHLHGKALAIQGMGIVVGPVVGPTLAGLLAELLSWRWAFFMMLPVAAAALAALWAVIPDSVRSRPRFDWTGFFALSIVVVCIQLVLDRGNRLGWFDSDEIQFTTAIGLAALWVFIAHTLTASNPFLPPAMFRDRNYAIGSVMIFGFGMLNIAPMFMLPPMLQNLMGYPDTVIGYLVGIRGIGGITGFFTAMWMNKLDPRIGMGLGLGLQAISGWMMIHFNTDIGNAEIMIVSVMQGFAVAICWVPMTATTFSTIDRRYLGNSTAVYHLLRNMGTSSFVSISVTVILTSSQINRSYLAEHITPFNELLRARGLWDMDTASGIGQLSGEINRQAAMIGYINAFVLYTVATLALLLLVPFLKRPKG